VEFIQLNNEVSVAGGVEKYYGKGFQHLDSEFCSVSPFKNLDLKADAHATAWGFKFSGSASFVKDINMTAETLAVSITAHRDVGTRWLDSGKLKFTEHAKGLIGDKDRFAEFYATYGGYFCVSYSRGGWVTILFMKECSSVSEKIATSLSLKAESQKAGGNVKATSDFAKKMESSGFTFKLRGDGHSPAPPSGFSVDKLVDWVANKWWVDLKPENAAITGISCDNLWQFPGVNLGYAEFLDEPTQNMTELTDAKIACSSIRQEADILSKDVRQNVDLRQDSETLESNAQAAVGLLDKHVKTNALNREPVATVLEGHALPEEMQATLENLQSKADKRQVVGRGDSFLLKTTGENEHFIGGVKHGQVEMTTSKSKAIKVRFHTDGLQIRIGNSFRIALPTIRGSKHIVSAPGNDEWLKMGTGKAKDRTWRIRGKAQNDETTRIYYGDRIMITNVEYPKMTIKSVLSKDGKFLGRAKGFTNHYLEIVKP